MGAAAAAASAAASALCSVAAVLTVLPNRTQFFQEESLTLSCGRTENSCDWRVMRNTSSVRNLECPTIQDYNNTSSCFLDYVFELDSGLYWCQSRTGDLGDTVNISVTAGRLILWAPVRPVVEGDELTLRCEHSNSSSALVANFYKDEVLVPSDAGGSLTLRCVSKSDEGLYKCVAGDNVSPGAWLAVAGRPAPPHSHLAGVVLPVVVAFLCSMCVMLLCLHRRRKGKNDADISYTDVIVTPAIQRRPQDIANNEDAKAASTLYSTLRLEPPGQRLRY